MCSPRKKRETYQKKICRKIFKRKKFDKFFISEAQVILSSINTDGERERRN
jgi:hypothetical protein